MSRVSLVRFADPLESVRQALGLIEATRLIRPGCKVLIKPNLHGGHGHTSPFVIEALCLLAWECGATRVVVADGPFWACPSAQAQEYFRSTGVLAATQAAGAELLNLHQYSYRRICPNLPNLPRQIGVTALLYECDVVINVPLLKTHLNTLVTIGIKNLKGCLRPQDKRRFHELQLDDALVGLARLVGPRVTVTVLDATVAVEGLGPAAGTEVEMGLIAASTDLVALDSVGCLLAGIEPNEVRVIRDCARAGLGEANLSRIEYLGENPWVHRRRFLRPYEEVAECFPDLRIVTEGACSACLMALFEALAGIRRDGLNIRVSAVAVGGRACISEGLRVGNCAHELQTSAPYVPGCPPSVGEIREGLTRRAQ